MVVIHVLDNVILDFIETLFQGRNAGFGSH